MKYENLKKVKEICEAIDDLKDDHETVKPETLTRALIITCSNRGDNMVVPFSGSGTECAMGVKEGRIVYGCEISQKHVDTSNRRIREVLRNPELF